jgi:hypothetical protein
MEHAQRGSFLIMEQSCSPLVVEMVPGKNCDFSNYLAKRARAQSGACAEVQFLITEESCNPLAVEIVPGKHCVFITYFAKRTRAQSGACAEVKFPDYGTELWSPGSRKVSRKALLFQHLSCQESASSGWRMHRGKFS